VVAKILLPGKLTTKADGVRGESYSNGLKYAEAIARAGGVTMTIAPLPQNLPMVHELVGAADAVLIQGGGDIDPAHYGESRRSDMVYGIVPAHDDFELAIVREAVQQDKPLLAICRGIQLLNVALGGSLHQDLGEILSDRESHWNTYHPVSLVEGSRVARAMGTLSPQQSHSFHHQSIKQPSPDLVITGSAPDGVIEAVEHRSCRWVVGVQWHPEDDAASESAQQKLFDGFVAACR